MDAFYRVEARSCFLRFLRFLRFLDASNTNLLSSDVPSPHGHSRGGTVCHTSIPFDVGSSLKVMV